MKKLLLTIIAFFLLAGMAVAGSQYLACDLVPSSITQSEIEITHNSTTEIVTGIVQTATDDPNVTLLLDLTGYSAGDYTFRARVAEEGGWWSEWSVPFDTSKPVSPMNLFVLSE